ncbi:Heavy metal-associated isoprenylated plant protein 7 [Dionaea muscipula]
MGEEEKKVAEEVKKPPEDGAKEKEADKKNADTKKTDEAAKDTKDDQPPSPPPPPPEIVLRVYMHCEGCARKVKKSLKGFDGVEDVVADCKTHKVVVKGEKADPMKVLERVQRKSHRHVELVSPIPKPPDAADEAKKPEEKPSVKAEEKAEEPKVITVVLQVHMHCEACAQEIKKRIERMKEVEVATPDLQNSEVTVKGTFEPANLVDYVYKRTGKHAVVVKQDPPPPPPSEAENKGKEEGKGVEKKGDDKGEGEKKQGDGEGGGAAAGAAVEEDGKVVELKANEYYYHPAKYGLEMYAYPYPPPQIFSDENPNACSIM